MMAGCGQYDNSSCLRYETPATYPNSSTYVDPYQSTTQTGFDYQPPSQTKLEYPKKLSDIAKIYSIAMKYNDKDQYTKTSAHAADVEKKLEKALHEDRTMVIKLLLETDSYYKPYDADTEEYKFFFENIPFSNLSYKFGYNKALFSFPVRKLTKKSRESGANAFGVVGHYEMEKGVYYGVFVEELNKKLYEKPRSPLYTVEGIAPDHAKKLRKNQEAFLICKPRISPNGSMACEINWYEGPKITSEYAWDIDMRLVNVTPIALLLCDKSTKKVLRQILF